MARQTRRISALKLLRCSPDEPAEYRNRGELESDMGVRKACRFSRALLGPCSGLEDREFGFKEGKPCVIVKLNRIVNFTPRVKGTLSRAALPAPHRAHLPPHVFHLLKKVTLLRPDFSLGVFSPSASQL